MALGALNDTASEVIIWFLVLFTPWAFGATENWSMKTADVAAYVLGLLLVVKWIVRWRTQHTQHLGVDRATVSRAGAGAAWLTRLLALLTISLLLYVLISALNARATYNESANTLEYHSFISWLPHTYDSLSTWPAFWNYLAWAAAFWALRDWLQAPPASPVPLPRDSSLSPLRSHTTRTDLPPRLRRLLWIISINGALLALEGLFQRATETNKLLWVRPTFYNPTAECQFGPYAYRANAAQYLNLVWPMTVGFWWCMQRFNFRSRTTLHHVLLPCVVLMITAPVVSMSRGGALIAAGGCIACGLVLVLSRVRWSFGWQHLGLAALLVAGLVSGVAIGGAPMTRRLQEYEDSLLARQRLTELARRMAEDYPLFGTGAETFQPLYQFYKLTPDEYWPGQLHDDWLETRITFGWLGFTMILSALLSVLARWFFAGGIRASWRFVSFIWIAMAGCLVHARWDFPFQVYSITLLFLIYCAVLLGVGRAGGSWELGVRS